MKGQATFVDVIILGVFISILLALGFTFSNQPLATQIAREEAFYANSMMLSAMQWKSATYGSFDNTNTSMSVAEAVDLYFTSTAISREDLEAAIGYMLNKTVKPGMDYIFYAEGGGKVLWVWNKQADVCAKAITVVSFELTPTAPVSGWSKPLLGIWPDWKKIPPKSACPAGIAG